MVGVGTPAWRCASISFSSRRSDGTPGCRSIARRISSVASLWSPRAEGGAPSPRAPRTRAGGRGRGCAGTARSRRELQGPRVLEHRPVVLPAHLGLLARVERAGGCASERPGEQQGDGGPQPHPVTTSTPAGGWNRKGVVLEPDVLLHALELEAAVPALRVPHLDRHHARLGVDVEVDALDIGVGLARHEAQPLAAGERLLGECLEVVEDLPAPAEEQRRHALVAGLVLDDDLLVRGHVEEELLPVRDEGLLLGLAVFPAHEPGFLDRDGPALGDLAPEHAGAVGLGEPRGQVAHPGLPGVHPARQGLARIGRARRHRGQGEREQYACYLKSHRDFHEPLWYHGRRDEPRRATHPGRPRHRAAGARLHPARPPCCASLPSTGASATSRTSTSATSSRTPAGCSRRATSTTASTSTRASSST